MGENADDLTTFIACHITNDLIEIIKDIDTDDKIMIRLFTDKGYLDLLIPNKFIELYQTII